MTTAGGSRDTRVTGSTGTATVGGPAAGAAVGAARGSVAAAGGLAAGAAAVTGPRDGLAQVKDDGGFNQIWPPFP